MWATAASIMDSLSPVQRCWTSAALTISDNDFSLVSLLRLVRACGGALRGLVGDRQRPVNNERDHQARHPAVVVERLEGREEPVGGEGAGRAGGGVGPPPRYQGPEQLGRPRAPVPAPGEPVAAAL